MVDAYKRWFPDYPGQQPWQDPDFVRVFGQNFAGQNGNGQHPGMQAGTQMSSANPPVQDMTPTIRTDIKQVESVEAIDRIPLAAGATGAYMTKDEKTIVFRTMYANGEHSDKIYDERPPAPPAPKFDPSEFVRHDELNQCVKDALAAYIATAKKEDK